MRTEKSSSLLKKYRVKKSLFWEKLAVSENKKLFSLVNKKVPAYKELYKGFLNKKNDFQKLPSVDKNSFLKKNKLNDLLLGGINQPMVFTSTSGSTGEPYYFPRNEQLDYQYSILAEQFLTQGINKGQKPTLVLVCFGMGVWIGGLITYQAFMMASRRGNYPVSILTPGINKSEILKALRALSPQFSETIIIGYPPFVKDVLDEAEINGIQVNKLGIRLMFAAEVFSEEFRDHLAKKVNMPSIYRDTLNVYGSADLGAMAWETGPSILLKRIIKENAELFKEFFGGEYKIPTIAQYNPYFIRFESPENKILLSGNSALPLVRYDIGDKGVAFSFSEMEKRLMKAGVNFKDEMKKNNIQDLCNELPFVCVFERNDFSTTLYGLQIYPEVVRMGLIHSDLENYVTGKFMMETKFNENHDQYLEINVELKQNINTHIDLEKQIQKKVFQYLTKKSSEFSELSKHMGDRALPKIVCWSHGDETYFKPGIKQKWVSK